MLNHSLSYAVLGCVFLFLCATTSSTSISYNLVSKTLRNEPCLNTCTNSKCYIDVNLNEQACTTDRTVGVPKYFTAQSEGNIEHCLSNCAKFGGSTYEWCYTTENYDWDYCNSVVRSPTEKNGRSIYGEPCLDECASYERFYEAPMRCQVATQEFKICSPSAQVPVQSYLNIFTEGNYYTRSKRSPGLDKIFSPKLCSPVCLARYRDGNDGVTERRIHKALTPGTYSNLETITSFPAGSPYTFVATTNKTNSRGDTVLLPLALRATLRRPRYMNRSPDDVPVYAATNVANMYNGQNAGIDTGHIVAFVNGGTRDIFNFVGQTAAVNRGPYKVIEKNIMDWIYSCGYAEFTVAVDYDGTEPKEFAVKIKFFNNDGSLHSDCLDIIITND